MHRLNRILQCFLEDLRCFPYIVGVFGFSHPLDTA